MEKSQYIGIKSAFTPKNFRISSPGNAWFLCFDAKIQHIMSYTNPNIDALFTLLPIFLTVSHSRISRNFKT